MAVSSFRCLSIVVGTLGAALWQDRSSELEGLIDELSAAISSEAEPGAQTEALRALRAVALSLCRGLASDSLPIVEEERFQDALSAALTFAAQQASAKQEGLDRHPARHLAQQVRPPHPSVM